LPPDCAPFSPSWGPPLVIFAVMDAREDLEKTAIVGDLFRQVLDQGAYLVVTEGEDKGRHIKVTTEPLLLGRSADADVRLQDVAASSRHCRVFVEKARVIVEDLNSTNGTFVDQVRVEGRQTLPMGGVLQIGRSLLRHEILDEKEVRRRESLTEELKKASDYVFSLLPEPIRSGPIRTSWQLIPSIHLGGDAFGYHRLEDGRLALYLLDVCGHGPGAALHTVSVINILRKGSLRGVDFHRPAEVLTGLNASFPMESHGGMYFTIWYGVYDMDSRRLDYASAGHPPRS
jgi:hypothetical protein